jgi:glycosyltransferase involved in cell wall biosynthesis/SAM-dependent methyltransferase
MRIAFFSPMPPAKSGIADYSAALVEALAKIAKVDVFAEAPARLDRSVYDIALYQLGNNPYHSFVYEQALAWPGVVVLHEANLHHLITDLTIRRKDWDAYMREVEFDGGREALAFAEAHVRTLQRGPDYEGVPMLRRICQASRGVVSHSVFVDRAARDRGFDGPSAVIPHGAWLEEADRLAYRTRLGLNEREPLIGTFGFLKPYKRIEASLRAVARLKRLEPGIKMILVGEPHPELPVESMIDRMGLQENVRLLGFTPISDFAGYMAACDVILNLRYPTVGESSGTMLRALGLGKAVLVSDVGSFREYPDDVCLKVPVDASEEDVLFELLNLMVTRPSHRESLGARAREWVARECNWDVVARRYLDFLEAVVAGRQVAPPVAMVAAASANSSATAPAIKESRAEEREEKEEAKQQLLGWATDPEAESYVRTHLTRLERTLEITPPGTPDDAVLEMGAYLQITPLLKSRLNYGTVRGCYYGPAGTVEHREVRAADGSVFACDIDLFDAEKDRFPYEDESFATVLCCELIEHLPSDPMHLMAEVNRILKPGGHLVLTTPNICSMRALSAILHGYHPGFFPAYLKPGDSGDARHNREYAPREIALLFRDAGFETVLLETGPFLEEPKPEHRWVEHLLKLYRLPQEHRGDGIYAVGRKTGPVQDRLPSWLYA